MRLLRAICLICAGLAAPHSWATAATAAPDPEGSGAVVTVGRALPLHTTDGRVVTVTVLGARMRRGGHRVIDVHLRYRLTRGATYRVDPAREAFLVDGTDQLVEAATTTWRAPALRSQILHRGQAGAGWVTFTLPTAAGAVRIQVTLESAMGPQTGQWRFPAQH
jgi:hypothetical protein